MANEMTMQAIANSFNLLESLLQEAKKEREILRNEILSYQKENESLGIDYCDAIAQRDTARRMFCIYVSANSNANQTPQEIANSYGWNVPF